MRPTGPGVVFATWMTERRPKMASNDDNFSSTGTAPDVPAESPAPVKKAAAKRAPRKATKKASAPQQTSVDGPVLATEAPADMTAAPARKVAKRAPRKSVKKSVTPPPDAESALEPAASGDAGQVEPTSVPATEPAVQNFGLLFQPPAPTEAPRRRRATAPAAAPAPDQGSAQLPGHTDSPTAPAHRDEPRDEPGEDGGRPVGGRGSGDSDDVAAEGTPRRRRRGGKGRRGRSSGEGNADEGTTTSEQDSNQTPPSDQPAAEDSESGDGDQSRRRTRRRRRGSAGDGDDQPTTTRVREPRPRRDEVTSVKGSTRLEAKKLRRREGREAGRRRTVITEAEFLARRESVERVMVVRHKQDRTQIGVLEDGVLVEHYVSRETNASMAGNVYLGRIQNVLPSMEAAFVDIGKGRNAVLYAGEVNWDAAGLDNRAKRIENALSSGQSVLVQVTKDPIGHKGARLTSQVSLPGRYLVYVPDGNMMGISRKLPDTERARLKKILREVVPENAGVIVRTAAEGASEEELRSDVTRLTTVWNDIQAKAKSANAPALLHGEPDLTVRVIRDVFNEDFAKLVVSGEPAWDAVSGYVNTVAPDLGDRVQRWTGEQDLFTHYRVDEQIAKAMDRKVWLPSGGTLVIDRTEAMTVVDVNTGKFVGSGGNLEETVTKNNIEAAEEVVRQLRLRDIGGIIVIDFIDMVLESNRDLVVRRLLECLGRDRTKHQVAEVTSLGLVQMTRKRVGAGLIEVFSQDCEHCNGRGIIVSADPIDRPASDGGNSGNGGGGNGGGNSGDGGGRGTRGRRGRASGTDNAVTAAPEPPAPTGGPTPAQIAAAAHAAAMVATAQREGAQSSAGAESSSEPGPPTEAEPVREDAPSTEQNVEKSPEVAVVVAEPKKSRRRSSRSATSPAFSVNPDAAPVTAAAVAVQPGLELSSFSPSTTSAPPSAADGAVQAAEVAVVKAPVVRARRKRPRVVAPAGPPPALGQPEAASSEFGS
jgi:ribonuclease E